MRLHSPSRLSTDTLFIGVLVLLVGFIFWISAYRPSVEIKRREWLAMPDSLARIARQDSLDKARLDSLNQINQARKLDSIALAQQKQAYLDSIGRIRKQDSLALAAYQDSLDRARKMDSVQVALRKKLADWAKLDSLNRLKMRADSLKRIAYYDSLKNALRLDSIALAAQEDSLFFTSIETTQTTASVETTAINSDLVVENPIDSILNNILHPQPEPSHSFFDENVWSALLLYLVLFGFAQVWVYAIIKKLWAKPLLPQLAKPISDLAIEFQRKELVNRLLIACFVSFLSGLLLIVYAPGLPWLVHNIAIFYLVLKYGGKDIDYLVYHTISQHLLAVLCQVIISIASPSSLVLYVGYLSWDSWGYGSYIFIFILGFALVFISIAMDAVKKTAPKTKKDQQKPKQKPENQPVNKPIKTAKTKGKTAEWTKGLDLATMTHLDLSNQNISNNDNELLSPIDECENLRSLNLSNNQLTELPFEVEFLEELEELNVSNNKISDLSIFDFSLLQQLRVVILNHNNLMQLPDELLTSPHLERLELLGNPFSNNAIKRFRKKVLNKNLILIVDKKATESKPAPKAKTKTTENQANNRIVSNEQNLEILHSKLKNKLKKPQNVTHISELGSCQLSSIPSGFLKKFPKLVYLNLGNNPLKELPESLLESKDTLEQLYIQGCQLSEIPQWLSEFQALKVLSISNNPLQELPFFLKDLTHLCELQLDSLSHLPQAHICQLLDSLPQLQKLCMRSIDFSKQEHYKQLFEVLANMPHLKSLDISFCNLPFLPDFILQRPLMEELYFSGNNIEELPVSGWENLQKLRTVYMGYNPKTILNEAIISAFAALPALYMLDLAGLKLQSLPNNIQQLKQLKTLGLQYNDLDYLPAQVLELAELNCLRLYNNNLQFLPEKLDKMAGLEDLSLENNPLQSLPDSLFNLQKLTQISLPKAWSQKQREALQRRLPNTVTISWG